MTLRLDNDIANMDPAKLLAEVRDAGDDEIDELMAGEHREGLLGKVLELMQDHFDPSVAPGVEAIIHFKVWDKPGGGYDHLEIVIENDECRISPEPGEHARVTIKARPADIVRIALGDASGFKLAIRGRLRVLGDIGFARKLPDLFPLPR